jgi:hypothetical protein
MVQGVLHGRSCFLFYALTVDVSTGADGELVGCSFALHVDSSGACGIPGPRLWRQRLLILLRLKLHGDLKTFTRPELYKIITNTSYY